MMFDIFKRPVAAADEWKDVMTLKYCTKGVVSSVVRDQRGTLGEHRAMASLSNV